MRMFSLSALADIMLIFGYSSNPKKRKAPPVIVISSDSSDWCVYHFKVLLIYVLF